MKNTSRTRHIQDIFVYGSIALVIIFICFLAVKAILKSTDPVTAGAVHWHAQLTYEACGVSVTPE